MYPWLEGKSIFLLLPSFNLTSELYKWSYKPCISLWELRED